MEYLTVTNSDNLDQNVHLIQKQTIESDSRFFNPGWFAADEDTIFSVESD